MTVKDQLKILDRKIKQNKADYDLYKQNAEISALSSGDLNKYEYLTNKVLGYKPIDNIISEDKVFSVKINKQTFKIDKYTNLAYSENLLFKGMISLEKGKGTTRSNIKHY